ncbi:antitoxin Xre/MbcA/ParS toxin-binding domain-containing protein [Microbacterium aerolatum]|uniref:antitoxin Xre/MbcA/ParS toxin-binding domain-containing protein n=1 Tax=Microbacterium aerolatum TaxID=153731 RepID=UPI00384AD1FA
MVRSRTRSSITGRHLKSAVVKNSGGTVVAKAGKTLASKAAKVTALNIQARTDAVAQALGSRAKLAQVLKVSASQPTRWISGDESPNSENTRAIVDLEHVVTRARLLWSDDETVSAWLNGRNAFLDGARPIDVIALEGSGPVIDALDQETAGVFA